MNDNLAYQEERREELIGGEIVMMAPSPAWNHVAISGNIFSIFRDFLRGKKCTPIQDGFDLHLDENNIFVPDFMLVCDRGKIRWNGVYGAPDLVAEVLSPSTAKNDRWYKKNVYEASGVPEYWLVNPTDRSIEVYLFQDGRYILDNLYTLWPAEQLADMTAGEKAGLVTEFKCHLFDNLTIRLEEVFSDLI